MAPQNENSVLSYDAQACPWLCCAVLLLKDYARGLKVDS